MTDAAYRKLIRRLIYYYNLKVLPDKYTVDMWCEELARYSIPFDKIEAIFDQLKQAATFPKNFPMAVRDALRSLLTSNGRQYTRDPPVHCDVNCDGGILFVSRYHVENDCCYSYAFRCKHCNRSDATGIPAAYLDQLQQDGYQPYPPGGHCHENH